MRSRYRLARFRRLSIATFLVGLLAAPAAAQTFGAQVGVSLDPDQFYFGGHVQTPPVVDRLHFRPNVEIGLGDDITLVGLNFEFVYRFSTQYPWALYAGGGPALNIIDARRDTHSEGGFNVVIGVAHRNGLFVEVKGGAMDSPNFKLGVGTCFAEFCDSTIAAPVTDEDGRVVGSNGVAEVCDSRQGLVRPSVRQEDRRSVPCPALEFEVLLQGE